MKKHDVIQNMIDNGWVFKYEPDTLFVGAEHENGRGKQSICEMSRRLGQEEHDYGKCIEQFLNGEYIRKDAVVDMLEAKRLSCVRFGAEKANLTEVDIVDGIIKIIDDFIAELNRLGEKDT